LFSKSGSSVLLSEGLTYDGKKTWYPDEGTVSVPTGKGKVDDSWPPDQEPMKG
jgi:hypothetical protein